MDKYCYFLSEHIYTENRIKLESSPASFLLNLFYCSNIALMSNSFWIIVSALRMKSLSVGLMTYDIMSLYRFMSGQNNIIILQF